MDDTPPTRFDALSGSLAYAERIVGMPRSVKRVASRVGPAVFRLAIFRNNMSLRRLANGIQDL
jgi:hypothetical protein